MSNPLTPSEIKKSIAMRIEKYIEEVFATRPEGIIIDRFEETSFLFSEIKRNIEGLEFSGKVIFPLINSKNEKLVINVNGFISDKAIRLEFSSFGLDFLTDEKGKISEIYPLSRYEL